jgi:hypothetical protein
MNVMAAGGGTWHASLSLVPPAGWVGQLLRPFGDHDAFAVADLPDNESAAAFALAVSEAGGATVRTVVLLTPEEVDAAAKHSVEYRPPMEWEARHF